MTTVQESVEIQAESTMEDRASLAPSAIRFTLDGDEALESHLNETCQRVLADVLNLIPEKSLEGIVLGGSYGRGEGGVLITKHGDRPYHNLDFYVCLRGMNWLNRQRYEEAFTALRQNLSPGAGVSIDFRVLSLSGLRRSPVSMFGYDLVTKHRWMYGDDRLFKGCERQREAADIPLRDATMLLFNRCSGLLFVKRLLEFDLAAFEQADLIGCHLAKAKLALGDALLTVYGQYHWSCLERYQRLNRFSPNKDLPWLDDVQRHYQAGAEFKIHPQRAPGDCAAFRAELAELSALSQRVWLWLESRRLNEPFATARDYALNPVKKCPETGHLHNRLVNVWNFGGEMALDLRAGRHPREKLMNALALLLWEPMTSRDPHLLHVVQAELQTLSSTFVGLAQAYQVLWERFS